MKKINEILTHLKNKTIKKFIESLPLKLKKGIKFAYIRGEFLYFVLSHPVYKMEFEYNKSLINSLLKKSKLKKLKEAKFFVTNKIEKKSSSKSSVFDNIFKERSYGIFENNIKDEKLHQRVENIRRIIKSS